MKNHTKYSQYLDATAPLEEWVELHGCPWTTHEKGGAAWSVRSMSGTFIYCFKCHRKVFIPSGKLSVSQTKRMLSSKKKAKDNNFVVDDVWLPSDFSLDIPLNGLMWLRRYGVTDDEIVRYRFGYSSHRNRLILPVFNKYGLVYWQGRLLASPDDKNPKYVNVKTAKKGTYFSTRDTHNGYTVIVEDILSAIAVSRAGYRGLALLGCLVDDELIRKLIDENCTKAIIWLDPDKRRESVKYAKRCNALGLRAVAYILPAKDPKDYNKHSITKMLGEHTDDE